MSATLANGGFPFNYLPLISLIDAEECLEKDRQRFDAPNLKLEIINRKFLPSFPQNPELAENPQTFWRLKTGNWKLPHTLSSGRPLTLRVPN